MKDKLGRFMKGNQFAKGNPPNRTSFRKGQHASPKTEFKKGDQIGDKHFQWKGGIKKQKKGYILIYSPDHPFCDSQKYVFEHRLVMEKIIGRYLLPKEVVHHINSITSDNRPENLMVFSNQHAHKKFEAIQEGIQSSDIVFDGHKFH